MIFGQPIYYMFLSYLYDQLNMVCKCESDLTPYVHPIFHPKLSSLPKIILKYIVGGLH